MRTWNHSAARTSLAMTMGLLLTACPFTDDYFIDSNAAHSGGTGGVASQGTGGASAGKSSVVICTPSNCAGTCCNDECVDIASDPTNCGTCSTQCSGGQACVLRRCSSGWSAMAPAPDSLLARERPAYVAMGDRLFIFGGVDDAGTPFNNGAIYDPARNRWTLLPIDANTPSPRRLSTAVWTGTLVVVFGGRESDASAGFAEAAAYNPILNQWVALPNDTNARSGALGVTNDRYSAFWGGWGLNFALLSGAERLDLQTSSWAPATSAPGADPGVLDSPAWAFTGQYLYLYGGRVNSTTKTNQGRVYDLVANSWSNLTSPTTGPTARWGAFGVWDGASFYVWAGKDESVARSDGAAFNGSTWTTMSATGAPTVRWAPARQTGWSFARAVGDLLFIGGQDASGKCLTNGGRYIANGGVTAGNWTAIPNWTSGEDHLWGASVHVGGTVLVWGGRNGNAVTATGDRWAP